MALGLAFVGVSRRAGAWWSVGSFLLEVPLLAVGGVLAVLATLRKLDGGDAWGRPMALAVVLLFSIGTGQVIKKKQAYPFMPFRMYGTAEEGPASYYEYEAMHASGRRSRFRPSTVVSTLGYARIVKGLARRFDAIDVEGADPKVMGDEQLLALEVLRILMRVQNGRSEDRISAIRVYRVLLPPPFTSKDARRTFVCVVHGTS